MPRRNVCISVYMRLFDVSGICFPVPCYGCDNVITAIQFNCVHTYAYVCICVCCMYMYVCVCMRVCALRVIVCVCIYVFACAHVCYVLRPSCYGCVRVLGIGLIVSGDPSACGFTCNTICRLVI